MSPDEALDRRESSRAAFHRTAAALFQASLVRSWRSSAWPALDLCQHHRGAAARKIREARTASASCRGPRPHRHGFSCRPTSALRRIQLHRHPRKSSTTSPTARSTGQVLREFWKASPPPSARLRSCASRKSWTSSTRSSARFLPGQRQRGRARATARRAPTAARPEARQVRAFIGCSTIRTAASPASLASSTPRPMPPRAPISMARDPGIDPVSGSRSPCATGPYGPLRPAREAEGKKAQAQSLLKGMTPDEVTLDKALALLSLPRRLAGRIRRRRADPGRRRPLRPLCEATAANTSHPDRGERARTGNEPRRALLAEAKRPPPRVPPGQAESHRRQPSADEARSSSTRPLRSLRQACAPSTVHRRTRDLKPEELTLDTGGGAAGRARREGAARQETAARAQKAKANGAADPAAPANDAGAKPAKKKAAAKRKAAKDKKAAPPPRTGTDG